MAQSSPNKIIWEYFEALRRHVARISSDEENSAHIPQDVALCIMLSVTVVEAFVNIYFRVVASEEQFQKHYSEIIDYIDKRSLDQKLKELPKKVFGKKIDFSCGAPQAFMRLKERRNSLMHFKSSHESFSFGSVQIHGLADTSALDTLTKGDASHALHVAESMVAELLRARGIPEDHMHRAMHLWIGLMGAN